VSNLGRIKALYVTKRSKATKELIWKYSPHILIGTPDVEGYLSVGLYDASRKQRAFRVHRLVAAAFVPNPLNKPVINHIDGVKWHNWASNIEWATVQENTQHAVDQGLIQFNVKHLKAISSLGTAKTKRKVRCIEDNIVYDSITAAGQSVGRPDDAELSTALHQRGGFYRGKHYEFYDEPTEATEDLIEQGL
jgi:hypothetical protein